MKFIFARPHDKVVLCSKGTSLSDQESCHSRFSYRLQNWKKFSASLLSAGLLFCNTACGRDQTATQPETQPTSSLLTESDLTPAVNPLNSIHFIPQESDPGSQTALEVENWSRWPNTSTAPYRMQVDMDLYRQPDRLTQPLAGITVVLDPGHGGKDPGAIGTLPDGSQIYEKNLNLQISELIKSGLESLGANVIMTRSEDSWVSLYRRISIGANAALVQWLSAGQAAGLDTGFISPLVDQLQTVYDINEDDLESGGRGMFTGIGVNPDVRLLFDLEKQTPNIIYLSVHCNSTGENTSASRGCLVYYCTNESIFRNELMTLNSGITEDIEPLNPNYTGYDDEARIRLATAVQTGVTAAVPELMNPNNIPPIHTGNFAFIRETNLTAILLECGYMSQPDELALLVDPAVQTRIAAGAVQGIKSYFNEPDSISAADQDEAMEPGAAESEAKPESLKPTQEESRGEDTLPITPADIPEG